jgi:hypothetical protein
MQFGILLLQFGILLLQFGILLLQFCILPLQFGINNNNNKAKHRPALYLRTNAGKNQNQN